MAKKKGAGQRSPKDWDPNTRILKTLAYDNHGYEYWVILERKTSKWMPTAGPQWTLIVDGTPGRWFMSTLMNSENNLEEIWIDYGQRWKITNFGDVLREAVTLI